MPHVSNQKLDSDTQIKLFKKLLKLLEATSAASELLTRTEKIMLAKRLAMIMMLSDDLPQHKISEILKVSPSTVARFSLRVESGQYKNIVKILHKPKIDLEKIVWGILTAGGYLPPRVGKRYWTKYRK